MGTGRSLDRDPPPLRHLVTRGYRLAWLILAVPDLTFEHTRYLEVARYSREVVKIIRHIATLVDLVQRIISSINLVKLVSWYGGHMRDWAEQTLDQLRPMYEGLFELWTVRNLYPKPSYTWCARRVGTDTACINADSPEELVRLLGEMACHCPRHAHPDPTR